MPVEIKELLRALGDRSRESRYLLDKKTGRVYCVRADDLKNPQVLELIKAREKEPARFVEVPKLPAQEIFKDMEAFLKILKNKQLIKKLAGLIGGGGGYRDFRDALRGYEREEKLWFDFREQRMKERLKNWLKTVGIRENF